MKTKVGDLFLIGNEWYLLAQVDTLKVALVGLTAGNRWQDPVEVKSIFDISPEEMAMVGTTLEGRGMFHLHVTEVIQRKLTAFLHHEALYYVDVV